MSGQSERLRQKYEAFHITHADFEPPRLPVAGIVTTFVAPTLVVVLPYFFAAGKESMQTLVIIALILLSVLLFVLFLLTYLRLYNVSYASQVFDLKHAALGNKLDELEEQCAETQRSLDALSARLDATTSNIDTISTRESQP